MYVELRLRLNSYNQVVLSISDTSLLCKVAPEDLKHFLLDCSRLQSVRLTYIQDIERIFLRVVPDHAAQLLTNKRRLCCIIMDCTVLADAVSGYLWEGFVNDMVPYISFEQKPVFCSSSEKNHIIE